MRALIIGCGYVGIEAGSQLLRLGHTVSGLRRQAAAAADLAAAGIRPLTGDITDAASLVRLTPEFDWVVNCAAPTSGGGTEDYRRVYLEGTRNVCRWLAGTGILKYVYTSSTGVYGQNDGAWVDETCPAEPASPTGNVLVEAEQELMRAHRESGFPAVVLRVAGIYGPGRGFYLRQLQNREARIEGTGARFINMVHRDDVAGAIITALEKGQPGALYNVCDEEPVSQAELYGWLAKRLGVPVPPSVPESGMGPGRRGVTNKRISSRRLREQLGYKFRYPTFREGYR
jgi:nucleoside-diphosphate-sugar epimerase